MATYVFSQLLNKTDGMTVIHSGQQIGATNTKSVTGASWFWYDKKQVSTIYINGSGWIGFGQSKHHLEAFYNKANENSTISYIARQEGVLDVGIKFLKLRIEGIDGYQRKNYIYEVFLLDNGIIYVHVIQSPKGYETNDGMNLYNAGIESDGTPFSVAICYTGDYSGSKPLRRIIFNANVHAYVLERSYTPITENGIRLKTPPEICFTGKVFTWRGLEVESYNSAGETQTVSNFLLPEINTSIPINKNIDVTYKSYKVSIPVVVKEDTVKAIEIYIREHYIIGEKIEVNSFRAIWESGKIETLTTGYEVSGFDSKTAGEKMVTFSYKGASVQKQVNIHTSAKIMPENPKTEYLINIEAFKEPEVFLIYDDGYKEYVYGATFSGFNDQIAGKKTITINYKNYTCTYDINITEERKANIGFPVETDVTATINVVTGLLNIQGTGAIKEIPYAYEYTGGLFDDGGIADDYAKEVIFGEGITSISNVCRAMGKLVKATLPSTLIEFTQMQGSLDACFDSCPLLTTINIPESLKTIAGFQRCTALTQLTLPQSVTTILEYTFKSSTNLELTILNRDVYIKPSEYGSMTALTYIKKLKGYIGSTAEKYALDCNIPFEAINRIQSIRVKTMPSKTTFWTLEELNTNGLQIEGIDEQGTVNILSGNSLSILSPDMTTAGKKDVVVKYRELQTTYQITVTAPAFSEILNSTTKMISGDCSLKVPWFNFDGSPCSNVSADRGIISITNGKRIEIAPCTGNIREAYKLETVLDNGIKVAKIRERCMYTVQVNGPTYITEYEFFMFSNNDFFINVISTDYRTQKGRMISNNKEYILRTSSGAQKIIGQHLDANGLDWKISQGDYAFPLIPKLIEITSPPTKIDYFTSEAFIPDGLVVTKVFGDGKKEQTVDYTVISPNMNTPGMQDVTVKENQFTIVATFKIYVNIKIGIGAVNTNDIIAKTDLRNGILEVSGTGPMTDFTRPTAPFVNLSQYLIRLNIVGSITRLGNSAFEGLSSLTTVNGVENICEIGDFTFNNCSIAHSLQLNEISRIGEFAFRGNFSDETTINKIYLGKNIKYVNLYAFSGCLGLKIIEVNKPEGTLADAPWCAYGATVKWLATINRLIIVQPLKKEYLVGDNFVSDGMKVTAEYSTGVSEIVTDYTLNGFETNTPGRKKVRISYLGKESFFDIIVYASTKNIFVSHHPTKQYYSLNEPLNISDIEISSFMADGTERVITDYTVSGFDSSTTGTKNVIISYTETSTANVSKTFSTDFSVQVTNDGSNPFVDDTEQIKIRVHFLDGNFQDLTNEHIQCGSMKIQESICSENYFIFGGCVSNQLTFKVYHPQFTGTDENSYPSGRIQVHIEKNKTDVIIFTGEIESGERDAGMLTRTIIAYDYLYKWRNADIVWWYKNLTVDKKIMVTQKQFRDDLFKYLGIEQVPTSLYYDNAYVPDTNVSNEINVVNTLKDMCLQNSVFGWMNREGRFEYLKLKENSKVQALTVDNKKIFGYFDSKIHLDSFKSFKAKEGRIWYPREFMTLPYPGTFYSGQLTAQESYEKNVYYNRNSFFTGNQDWLDGAFQANEYGIYTLNEPLFPICYGTRSFTDEMQFYRAQEYTAEVTGNPYNMVGDTIEMTTKRIAEDGTEIIWKVHSYIMSRTLHIGATMLLDTYSAKNNPYNGNNRQEGKHTAEFSAELFRQRSERPYISYAEFTDGTGGGFTPAMTTAAVVPTALTQPKKVALRCMKRIPKDVYDALAEKRNDTLYFTYEELV